MKCNNCKEKILKGSIYCGNCGKKINNEHKSKKKIIIGLVLFVLIFIVVGLNLRSNPNLNIKDENNEFDINSVSLEYEYLSTNNKGEYTISDADPNISFEVTEGTNFKILDQDNNKIDTQIIDNKIVNITGYEKGKQYTLTIENGNFVSEDLKDINKITFKIARDYIKKYELQKNVIKVQTDEIEIINNKIISNNISYNTGDVIVIYDNKTIKDAYKVKGKDAQNNYIITKASIKDIYSELDFYYEEYANLSNYKTTEQIKDYIITSAENSKWYNAIVETVHAKPELEITLNNAEEGIEAEVKVVVSAGDSSVLLDIDYHNFEFTYTHKMQVKLLVDATLDNWDVSTQIINNQDFNIKLDNKLLEYEGNLNKKIIEKIQNAIKNNTNTDSDNEENKSETSPDTDNEESKNESDDTPSTNSNTKEEIEEIKKEITGDTNSDSDNKELELVVIPIPTSLPGLTLEIQLGIANEINMSVDLETGVSFSSVINMGFDYGENEEFKTLFLFDFDEIDTTAKINGNIGMELGPKLDLNIDFVGVFEGGITGNGGLYSEASTSLEYDINSNSATLLSETELGIFAKFDFQVEIVENTFIYPLIEKKYKLYENNFEYKIGEPQIIKFDTDGGSLIEDKEVQFGQKLVEPQPPIKEGYIFEYWEKDNKKYNFDEEVHSSFKLKAVWKKVENNTNLADIKNNMKNLKNYSYNVKITAKTEYMDIPTIMMCKEDLINRVGYCNTSEYGGVKTEDYIDYNKNVMYSKTTNPYSNDSTNNKWSSIKFNGNGTNSWVNLIDDIKDIKVENKNNSIYYKGSINSDKLMNAIAGANSDVNSSGIINELKDIEVFVNTSGYIEKISFNITVIGVKEDVEISFNNFNTSGSITIPKDVK